MELRLRVVTSGWAGRWRLEAGGAGASKQPEQSRRWRLAFTNISSKHNDDNNTFLASLEKRSIKSCVGGVRQKIQ